MNIAASHIDDPFRSPLIAPRKNSKYYRLGMGLARENGISWERAEHWGDAIAVPRERLVIAPPPNTRLNLLVFTHECGHIIKGHSPLCARPCQEEREAWAFAFRHMRQWRLMLPQFVELARLATINVPHNSQIENPRLIQKMFRFTRNRQPMDKDEIRKLCRIFEFL